MYWVFPTILLFTSKIKGTNAFVNTKHLANVVLIVFAIAISALSNATGFCLAILAVVFDSVAVPSHVMSLEVAFTNISSVIIYIISCGVLVFFKTLVFFILFCFRFTFSRIWQCHRLFSSLCLWNETCRQQVLDASLVYCDRISVPSTPVQGPMAHSNGLKCLQ